MHNLHFILVKADSAADAASEAESLILDWGNENNWRTIGGIASEDGSDDIENHDDGRWGLSFLDEEEGTPEEAKTVAGLLGWRRGDPGTPAMVRPPADSLAGASGEYPPPILVSADPRLDHGPLTSLHGQQGTYFSRALDHLCWRIAGPVTLPCEPFSTHLDLASALCELSDRLRAFDPDRGETHNLWCLRRNLKYLSELVNSRRALRQGEPFPELYRWQLDEFGLTDVTEHSDGARRYLVFLDMHS